MKAYRIIAHLISACVVLQATWIALSMFTLIGDVDDGKTIDDNYRNLGANLHGIFAMIIPVLALALLIVSFFAKVPSGPKFAGIVVGLVALQWVLAILAFSVPALGILHGLNAFAIVAASEIAARRAGETSTPAATAPATVS